MIVLNSIQKTVLLDYLKNFKNKMAERSIDCRPVKIKSGNYILPEVILINKEWSGIFKTFSGWQYRNISTDEFIVYNFI